MSRPISTAGKLSSNRSAATFRLYRCVEAQHFIATMRLADSVDEQAILERAIERVKPAVPTDCAHLHYLLAAPFRYTPYPHGSRFRRAGNTPGVFYGSENERTALAENAFHALLFLAESPQMEIEPKPVEKSLFSVGCSVTQWLDLTLPPLDRRTADWMQHDRYEACQDLAERAHHNGLEAIRYRSVRDRLGGYNVALLNCRAFAQFGPDLPPQTWHLQVTPRNVAAVREFPHRVLEFPIADFSADPRLAPLL